MKQRLVSVTLFVLFLAGGCSTVPEKKESKAVLSAEIAKPVAFVNVNVIPMDRERVLKNQTVIVKAGHIAVVGPCSEVEIPEDALRIDGKNKYLLPGLADMHSHEYGTDDLLLMVANGVTTVRWMGGSPKQVEARTKIALGELIGPNVYASGPIIWGKPRVATAADGAAEVARHKAAGYDFIKVYNEVPLDAYNGLVAAAKAHGLRVVGHVPFEAGLYGALEAGQRTIEHLRGYIWKIVPEDAPEQPSPAYRDRSVVWQYADVSRMPALAQATVEAGVFNCPTLMFPRYGLAPQEVRNHYYSQPFAVYMGPPPPAPNPDSKKPRGWWDTFTEQDFEAVARGYAKREALVRALRDAGAKILAGTDVEPAGFALHLELQNLVEAGLTPYETLVAATRNPAEALGQPDIFGTVTVSKRADLILVSANPIDDIANASRLCGVMVSGRWYPKKELDRFLEEVRQRRAH
ncbi:MAG: amidohydrolase family protein [Planctomycetota bacterium]|jgi:imidazolonepropionase-like amidohydrolase